MAMSRLTAFFSVGHASSPRLQYRAVGLALCLLSAASGASAADGHAQLLAGADPGAVTEKMLKTCAKCHGDEGISDDDEVPHLAGQRASYMLRQLIAFKTDAREGGRMNKTARKLSEQDMANLSTLFAAKTLPPMRDEPVPSAPALVTAGDAGRNIKACSECHGSDGRGKQAEYDAPALAGMPFDYFVATMHAFADGGRSTDKDRVMREPAAALNEGEVDQLAAYYLALGKRQRQPQ